jgi:hypothetical protein
MKTVIIYLAPHIVYPLQGGAASQHSDMGRALLIREEVNGRLKRFPIPELYAGAK